jgi:CBS domain-containing protein
MSFKVKEYMNKTVETIDGEANCLDAAKQMAEKKVSYLIVLEKARPAGIITEKDLVAKVMAKKEPADKTHVKTAMSKPLITAKPDDALEEVVKLMGQKDIRRVPIVKDGILYGIFTTKDLAAHFNEIEDLIVRDLVKNLYCPY